MKDSNIIFTLEHYPEKASEGWCFVFNRILHEFEDNNWHFCNEREIRKLAGTRSVLYAKLTQSYTDSGVSLPGYYPVFFKAEDPKTLEALGCISFSAKKADVSRWELLDI